MKSKVCSQTILKDSSICFTLEQSKVILKDLKRVPIMDSINDGQARQIANYKQIILGYNLETTMYQEENGALMGQLKILNLKYKGAKLIGNIGIPAAIVVGFICGFALGSK